MGSGELLTGAFSRLVEVVARLRGERGCPWDREQTRATLRRYVIEEAHEVLEALDGGDPAKIRDELGDLLFQIVLHAQIGSERGEFDLASVAAGLAEKLVRRHPHVFGGESAPAAAAVEARWEEWKRAEAPAAAAAEPRSALAGVPAALPALARAQKLQERAARVGFDWPDRAPVLAKLDEERAELGRAIESDGAPPRPGEAGAREGAAAIEHELGDLLFTVVNLARFCKVHAEDALRAATSRFAARFRFIEDAAASAGRNVNELTLPEMDELWNEAKSLGR